MLHSLSSQVHERLVALPLEPTSRARAHLGTEEEFEVVETDGVTDGDDGVGLADGGNGAEAVEEAVEVRLGQEEGAEIS